jgi:hypothetical protein
MGHGEEALRIAATGLALGQDCGRYGMLLTGLVQLVCEGSLLETLQPMFGEHTFTPAGLAEFSETLDRLDAARPDFMDCWKGEELLERKLILDQRWDDLFNRMPVRPSWRALWSERITRAQALVRIHECYRQVEELRLLPPWERIAAADKIDRGNHLTGGSSSSGNVLVDLAMPSFSRSFRRDAIAQLGRVLLRVSVAIARFEGDQGRNPSQLDELLPKYLPMLPVCPLTGTPLRYKDGKVWSVGENLVDDGGTVDVHTPDSGGAGDVVWTVKRK